MVAGHSSGGSGGGSGQRRVRIGSNAEEGAHEAQSCRWMVVMLAAHGVMVVVRRVVVVGRETIGAGRREKSGRHGR